jgi:hypothetical protein
MMRFCYVTYHSLSEVWDCWRNKADGTQNVSEMVAVQGSPCATTPLMLIRPVSVNPYTVLVSLLFLSSPCVLLTLLSITECQLWKTVVFCSLNFVYRDTVSDGAAILWFVRTDCVKSNCYWRKAFLSEYSRLVVLWLWMILLTRGCRNYIMRGFIICTLRNILLRR